MDMEKLKRMIDLVYLFFEYIILRNLRLIWVPKIAHEESVEKRVVVVTGANTGLGKATTKILVEKGATVVLACRNLVEGQKAVDDIKKKTGAAKEKLVLMKLDLSDLDSVEEFATALKKKFNAIHILINNAGIFHTSASRQTTKQGFEAHMGVNHLGHFLLTNLLLDLLKNGTPSRVVTVSSHLMLQAQLKMDDIMLEKDKITPGGYIPYNNSKLANALFTTELAKRLRGTGVTSYAICPGLVSTDVFRNMSWIERLMMKIEILVTGVPVETGCEATLFCALSKMSENQSGKVFHYNKELSIANKILAKASSGLKATELWEKSAQLVDLKKRLS